MTDTDALTERIAGTLWGHHGADGMRSILRPDCYVLAAAVLPIVAEEVRKAKAEAWDEAHEIGWNNADEYWRCDGLIPSYSKADTYPNPYRETGDSDERR